MTLYKNIVTLSEDNAGTDNVFIEEKEGFVAVAAFADEER